LPPSAPKPDPLLAAAEAAPVEAPAPNPRAPEARLRPFQWNLLAWAALIGALTGLAIVGFHLLLGLINNFLFGPFVEGLLVIARSQPISAAEIPAIARPPLEVDSGTPLRSLLQLGLSGIGLLPPADPTPLPLPAPLADTPDWLALWPVVVVPTLGGLAVGLLRWLGGSLGPGLPSLMAMADGAVPSTPRLPLLRILAASLSLGSGASLGPEGPSVESGGNIGLWLAQRAGLPPEAQKGLVAAGVAAGLAAGFKAPIAGVFFAFEGSFSSIPGRPSLRAVLVAAVASALVTELCLDDDPILRLPAYDVRSPLELPLYLGLGLLASLMSWALVTLMAAGRGERIQGVVGKLPPGLATALGGAAVGAMALLFPQVLGVGYDTIESLLGSAADLPLLSLLLLIGVKLLATTISNAMGFVGGGFAPALVLGAVLGNAYGQLLGDGGLHLPVAQPPAYAMVGMAAVLAGSARAPLTALLLLFELTRDIRIVLPLMAAAGLSAALVERWRGLGDAGLLGPDPIEEQRRLRLARIPVAEAFEREAPLVLPAGCAAVEALAQLVAAHSHCLLVEEGGSVVGLVTLPDLQRALSGAATGNAVSLGECRRGDLVWLPLSARLDRLEDQLSPNGLRQVAVFAVAEGIGGYLPSEAPSGGLPITALCGVASRDGLAVALARQLHPSDALAIRASATGSA
ncbi:MAG: chloride channel protein, partial [Cyanobium sp.]